MKRNLLVLCAVAMFFASCNFNSPVKPANHDVLNSYVGDAVIDSDYVAEALVVDFITSDSIKGAYIIYFHDAKFAEKMPAMDIIIDGIEKVSENTYECDNIVPDMVMGLFRIPVEKYLITNLHLVISEQSDAVTMSLKMNCGPYFLDYSGVYHGE